MVLHNELNELIIKISENINPINFYIFVLKKMKKLNSYLRKKIIEDIKEIQPFIYININNINNNSNFYVMLSKYKEIHSYACECKKKLM